MIIRPYRAEDLHGLIQLFTHSVHVLAAPYYDQAQRNAWAPIPDPDSWRDRFRAPTLVAESDVLLGFLTHDGAGYVDYLYVAPTAARKGVARELLGAAFAEWAPRHVTRAHTEASLAARPFFESQGFHVVEKQHVARSGQLFVRFRMERILDLR